MRSTSSSSRCRCTVPRRIQYWRSLVAIASLICRSVRPLLPRRTMPSIFIWRPSFTVKMTFTSPSPNSPTLSWTSSKKPSAKVERTSSVICPGLKAPPRLDFTRPRMTASWTRRLPSTVSSLMRTGGCCAATAAARPRTAVNTATARRKPPPRVTGAQARAGWCLVLSKLEGSVGGLGLAEDELSSHDVHFDPSALGHLPAHDGLGERILDVLLDRQPQLARSVLRVVALVHQDRLGGRREDELDALLGELLVDLVEHQANDLLDVRQRQRVEHDDVVDPVDELRPERPLHLLHHAVLHLLVGGVLAFL